MNKLIFWYIGAGFFFLDAIFSIVKTFNTSWFSMGLIISSIFFSIGLFCLTFVAIFKNLNEIEDKLGLKK